MRETSNKTFKKVPIEDVEMMYDLYCRIEKCTISKKDSDKAKKIYGELLNY